MDRPPLTLMVLDGLADDFESVEDLRSHGEVPAYGLALADETEVLGAVRSLLDDGLIQAFEAAGQPVELVHNPAPQTDDDSLRGYWFRWTARGEQVWGEGRSVLDAYYDANPIEP